MIKRVSTLFYARKDKSKTGSAPIYLRVTLNGIRGEVSIGHKIALNKWDAAKQQAKGTSGETLRLNAEIERLKADIYDITTQYDRDDKQLTTKLLITHLSSTAAASVKTLLDLINAQYERVCNQIGTSFSKATATRYNTIRGHMQQFLPLTYKKDDVALYDLNYNFVEKYATYLREVRKCNHNSTMKYIKMLKAVIHYAQKQKWIINDPFVDYQCSIEKTDTIFLTKQELSAIQNKELAIGRLSVVRDIFVFACYTGLSYIDICKLTPVNIVDHNEQPIIKGRRQKTNEQFTTFLFPICLQLIEKYRGNPICEVRGSIFPVPSNQKVNAYLKELGDLCGIDKNLTFHAARRTFATTICLANGIPTEVIQQALGHSNIKTTQIYARTTEELIINSFKTLNINEKPI